MKLLSLVKWTSFILAFNFIGLSERDGNMMWSGVALGCMILTLILQLTEKKLEQKSACACWNRAQAKINITTMFIIIEKK